MKKCLFLITLLIMGVVGLLIGGCGGSTTTYTYFYPDWTPDGNIVCVKLKSTSSNAGGFGGSPSTSFTNEYYLTLMNEYGSNEVDVKKIGQLGKVAASPLGNYYAYTDGSNIKLISTQGAYVRTIACEGIVDSLDWGPDEDKLVYGVKNNVTGEVYIVNSDGTLHDLLAVGENVAWRYGNKIIFEYLFGSYTYTATIDYDGTNRENLDREDRIISPQVLNTNTNKVYGAQGTKYGYVDIGLTIKVFVELFGDFDGYLPRLSKNAYKVVYTDYSDAGIWVLNILGTGEAQVK